MGLREYVTRWAQRAMSDPAAAVAPDNLTKLVDAATDSWDGMFGAQNSPIAALTWEQRLLLLGTKATSQRQSFQLPFPLEIVGIKVSICSGVIPPPGGLVLPTMSDIEVALDRDQTQYFTNQNNQDPASGLGAADGTFVTLSSVDVLSPRLFGIKLIDTERPTIGFTARWKAVQPTPPAAAYFQDVILGFSLLVRRWDRTTQSSNAG